MILFHTYCQLIRKFSIKYLLMNRKKLMLSHLYRFFYNNYINAETFARILMINLTGLPIISFQMRRRHFPLKIMLAMTINKEQGQTLQMVKLFLPDPVFIYFFLRNVWSWPFPHTIFHWHSSVNFRLWIIEGIGSWYTYFATLYIRNLSNLFDYITTL